MTAPPAALPLIVFAALPLCQQWESKLKRACIVDILVTTLVLQQKPDHEHSEVWVSK